MEQLHGTNLDAYEHYDQLSTHDGLMIYPFKPLVSEKEPTWFAELPQACLSGNSQGFTHVDQFAPRYDSYYVYITQDSPKHPFNKPKWRSYLIVLFYAMTSLGSQVSTAMFGQSAALIQQRYNVTREVAVLPTTLFMFGIAFGPLMFAPVSEKYGRKLGVLVPYSIASVLTTLTYFVDNLPLVLVTRFFTGFLASPPIISSGGALKDMFRPAKRADMLLMYAIMVASGPVFGPILGGAITQSMGDFRFIYVFVGGFMCLISLLSLVIIEETFLPLVEEHECKQLGREFIGSNFHCRHTLQGKKLPLEKYLQRPYRLLWTSLLGWLSLYACFAFGIMYMSVASLANIMMELYGWNQALASGFNITQFLGILLGTLTNLYFNTKYKRHVESVKQGGAIWRPEIRLGNMIVGSVVIPVGFLLLRLGSFSHWAVIGLSQICIGCGFFSIFQSSLNYVIDVHGHDSASAVSAITLLRSIAAGVLPMCASSMIHRIGLANFCHVMLGASAATIPLPVLVYRKWHKLREQSMHVLKGPQ